MNSTTSTWTTRTWVSKDHKTPSTKTSKATIRIVQITKETHFLILKLPSCFSGASKIATWRKLHPRHLLISPSWWDQKKWKEHSQASPLYPHSCKHIKITFAVFQRPIRIPNSVSEVSPLHDLTYLTWVSACVPSEAVYLFGCQVHLASKYSVYSLRAVIASRVSFKLYITYNGWWVNDSGHADEQATDCRRLYLFFLRTVVAVQKTGSDLSTDLQIIDELDSFKQPT